MNEEVKKIIIEIFNLQSVEPAKQDEMLERMSTLIFQGVTIRAIDALSDEEAAEFEKFMDGQPEPQEMLSWLSQKVPSFQDMIVEEIMKLKAESDKVMKATLDQQQAAS